LPDSKVNNGHRLDEVLETLKPYLLGTLRDLVRIPSENLPPTGRECACQAYVADRLRELDLQPDVYDLTEVPELKSHPSYWPGREYARRPNVNAVLRGGPGRSLILSGHIDTVPVDTPVPWGRAPLEAQEEGGRLYGRGAWDMKAGVAMNLTVMRAVREFAAERQGDLIFETVVDEEFGGANGTLAGRLRGYNADAAVIGETTSLRICPAQRGGRVLHLVLNGHGGMLHAGCSPGRAVDQLAYILGRLPDFTRKRESRVAVDPYFATCEEPFAVWVTNVSTGRWGWTQPITIPERCWVELYWQTMPNETEEEAMREFLEWWSAIQQDQPALFAASPELILPMRWLPGCSIPTDTPLVREFVAAAASAGVPAPVEGLDSPSDMFVFQNAFNTPALMWGPSGGNAHQPDEYVDVNSVFESTRVLLRFVSRWCGIEFTDDSV
jgi:acetylornithine deacetylase